MNNRILFMIIDNQVLYLSNSEMDHKEWYTSLGFNPENFENIVRGYIIENKIVFFKGINFNYDEEVIKTAKMFASDIRTKMNNPLLEVYCGIVINSYGEKWEPVLKINNEELTGVVETFEPPKEEVTEHIDNGPIIEFKNDYSDPIFIKRAVIVSFVILILSIISKIVLFKQQRILHINNGLDIILSFLQVGFLIGSIYGYIGKKEFTKYLGIAASVCLILIFDMFNLILGIIYFVFSIDQSYFSKMYVTLKDLIEKLKNLKKK